MGAIVIVDDQVEEVLSSDLAEDDVALFDDRRVFHRLDSDEVTVVDLAAHGVAARTKLHRLPALKLLNPRRCPTHDFSSRSSCHIGQSQNAFLVGRVLDAVVESTLIRRCFIG